MTRWIDIFRSNIQRLGIRCFDIRRLDSRRLDIRRLDIHRIKIRWIGFVAARYVSRGRRNSPSPTLSVLGIATGVLALTVIIAVMNGFQLGFIESILEISSYHLRLEDLPPESGDEFTGELRARPEVLSVLPFRELNVLLRGRQTTPRGALVRGVPPNAFALDPGLAGQLEIEEGGFDLDDPYNIVLGAELARQLSVKTGDRLSLLSITDGIRFDEEGGSDFYTVSGIFRSGFYEYDLGWAFMDIDKAAQLSGELAVPVLGIKLKNRWQDQRAMSVIKKLLADSGELGANPVSWREYNRAFFGALRTEKLIMFILVGLIFVVVGLNIFQAQRRIVLERREEIGLLRALGASNTAVRLVFVCDGLIIGLAGAGLGLVPGLLVAFNIPAVFSFLEGAVNLFIAMLNSIFDLLGANAGAGEFALFSPQIFYIKEIPSRVIPHEVLLIFLFGFFSALFAAWFASGKVAGIKPAEVLRYE